MSACETPPRGVVRERISSSARNPKPPYGCGQIRQVRIKQTKREREGLFGGGTGGGRRELVRIPVHTPASVLAACRRIVSAWKGSAGRHMRGGVRKRPNPTPYVTFEPLRQPCEKASRILDFSTCGRGRSSPHVSEKERGEGGFQGGFGVRIRAPRPHVWDAGKRRKARELHDKNRPRGRRSLTVEKRFEATRMVEGMLLPSKLLRIGRLAEFADSNVSSRNANAQTLRPTGARIADPISSLLSKSLVLQ